MIKVVLSDLLEFNTFNPENIDVSDIQSMSKNIPKDGNVDIAIADKLAIQFLRGADLCSELIGKLSWWVAKKKDEAREALQHAALVTAPSKGYKTVSEKKMYADGDPKYQEANSEFNKAEAMLLWVKNKHSSLVSAHYMMKQIAKESEMHFQASNVSVGESSDNKLSYGEQPWG